MKEMPRLDLAPKLKRPLQLWNPLDYLRLLYWVFYFPQALRWYVDTFGGGYIPEDEMNVRKGLQLLRENVIQRTLLIQGIIIILITPTSLCWLLDQLSFVIDWFGVAFGVVLGVMGGMAGSIAGGVAGGVSGGVAFGVAFGVAGGVAFGVTLGAAGGVVGGLVFGVAFGVVFGVARGVAVGVVFSVMFSVIFGVVFSMVFSVIFGVAFGVAFGVVGGLVGGIFIWRPDSWLIGAPLNFNVIQNSSFLFPRVAAIPLPFLENELKNSLWYNWEKGLQNSDEFLRYSNQLIAVSNAVNQVLCDTIPEQIVWKTARLAHQPFDWKLVEFASIPWKQQIQATFERNLLFWRTYQETDVKITESPRLNTLPRATAAGFWYLHEKDATHATEAFNVVRHILYGEEMYILAQILDLCIQVRTFNQIHPLQLPPCPEPDPSKRLRQESWPALETLHCVTQDAQLIHRSSSKVTCAQALAHAQGELQNILDHQDELPQAESGLIIDIATTWSDALLSIASDIDNLKILEPVTNPYTIGDPVEGNCFVGREDLLRELKSLWFGAESPPSVLVYGQRRMGKTSILRNLTGGSDLKLIYVNLQLLGSVSQGLSEVLLAIADDIAQHLDIPAPPDEAFLNFPQRTFERYLRDVLSQLKCRALIIALDEFEIIEDLIEKGQLSPDFMGYLRGLIQMDKRLAFALAGLHTLEEMTRDYFQPFFGSTYGLRVSFLTEGATRQVLENPSDDFPLEYDPNAVDEIYRLTHGQPYLVQLIGFQLVRRFNEQVFETGRERDPRLTVADVNAVTDISQADLFRNGRYYFEGVWNQAAQGALGQQAILQALALHPDGLTAAELQSQLIHRDVLDTNLEAALDTLMRHDAIQQREDRYRITVELFWRWCERLAISHDGLSPPTMKI